MSKEQEQKQFNSGGAATSSSAPSLTTQQPNASQSDDFKFRGAVGILNPTAFSDRNAAESVKGYKSGDNIRYGRE